MRDIHNNTETTQKGQIKGTKHLERLLKSFNSINKKLKNMNRTEEKRRERLRN